MLNVGVIGLGWMGKVHLRNYSEMHGVKVMGVVDTDQATLDEVAARFGVATFTNLDELLRQGLDAVSVCVPTSLHHEVGLKVIASGASLLIEKPLAATSAEGASWWPQPGPRACRSWSGTSSASTRRCSA